MACLTLSGLMTAVTQLSDDDLLHPVEILALLNDHHDDPLFDAQFALDRSTYLVVTSASNNPATFYAEPPTEDHQGGYLTFAMLKTLGERLQWLQSDDEIIIASELTAQRFRIDLHPVGVHGKLIIAKESMEEPALVETRQ